VDTRITLTPGPVRRAPAVPCPCCREARRMRWLAYGMAAYAGILGAAWMAAAGVGFPGVVAGALLMGAAGATACALALWLESVVNREG
jgi:hypothetical protein